MLTEVAIIITRVTLLFAAALVFLRIARRLPPQTRHLACATAMGLSFAMLVYLPLAALHPEYSTFTIRALEVSGLGGVQVSPDSAWTWGGFALAVWALGFAAVILRFAIGSLVLDRVRRGAAPLDPGGRILAVDVSVPMAAGLFAPVVLMPRESANWPQTRREAALRHEMAHLERGDLRTNFFGLIICAIYWFHPLAWVVFRRMREEQEAACDDLVVEAGFDRAAYAEALLDVSRGARSEGLRVTSCPMTNRGGVKERIVRVLSTGEKMPSKAFRRSQRFVSAAAMLVFFATTSIGTERIYTVGGAVTAPVIVRTISPIYPAAAKLTKIRGTVQLSMVVGDDGTPRDIVVTRRIDPDLDRNAVAAVRLWKLRPAMRNGTPVAARARVEVNFRLK